MGSEKFNITWHSHADQTNEIVSHLYTSGEASDVTLVCDDQVKFKAHTFILKQCSQMFKSILEESNNTNSIVYLRGINHVELESILEFIYCGQTTLYQDRMQEFLKVGKDLKVKEIENTFDCDEKETKVFSEEAEDDDNKNYPMNKLESNSSPFMDKSGKKNSVEKRTVRKIIDGDPLETSKKCPDCDITFSKRFNMLKHYRNKHEGVTYPCKQCSFHTTELSNLKRHMNCKHMPAQTRLSYPCKQCGFDTTELSNLRRHIKNKHMDQSLNE